MLNFFLYNCLNLNSRLCSWHLLKMGHMDILSMINKVFLTYIDVLVFCVIKPWLLILLHIANELIRNCEEYLSRETYVKYWNQLHKLPPFLAISDHQGNYHKAELSR